MGMEGRIASGYLYMPWGVRELNLHTISTNTKSFKGAKWA